MTYSVSGYTDKACKIFVIDVDTDTLSGVYNISEGNYIIENIPTQNNNIIAIDSTGEVKGVVSVIGIEEI